jgi:urease accessory protein
MNELLVWQLVDSGFPSGSFAHSFGLEAAWHHGEVDAGSLHLFVCDAVEQAGWGTLAFVTHAHGRPEDIGTIDARCDAFLRNPVANRASRVQGRSWLTTIERSFPTPEVRALCERARRQAIARHHAVMFGATLSVLDVDPPAAQRMFLFGVSRGIAAAAVRLGIVGTMEAQRLVAESAADLDRTLARCSRLTMDEAALTAPLIDLWQSGHTRLYSRLFQS